MNRIARLWHDERFLFALLVAQLIAYWLAVLYWDQGAVPVAYQRF